MKRFLIGLALLTLCYPVLAQSADEPASKDDVILYLRTMHSHDMMQRVMQVQAESMRQLFRGMQQKDGKLPADFDTRFKKEMDDLIKNMPWDELVQAIIPSYQKHFTKGEIEAMNAFYSSPVGQKVLEELPAVMQEGSQAAMPIMSKYLADWKERMRQEFGDKQTPSPDPKKPAQN